MKNLLFSFLLTCAALQASFATAAEKVTVFAAASMKDVLDAAVADFKAKGGSEVVVSLAASSVLAKQIEAGAPANVFISADLDWMDYLAERDLIDKESRRIIAGNALVIAASEKGSDDVTILTHERFAMGDPSNVPAGKYGKAALESLGVWADVEKNAVFTENVRVALEFVRKGELKAAIVYASDRAAAPGLVEAYRFPASSHKPVVYPAAAIGTVTPEIRAFLDYLSGEAGQAIISEKGFVPAAEAGS
ncbi:MAG: molybdate ABC transporter substrate-binding protein [Phyllobacterium sp.]